MRVIEDLSEPNWQIRMIFCRVTYIKAGLKQNFYTERRAKPMYIRVLSTCYLLVRHCVGVLLYWKCVDNELVTHRNTGISIPWFEQ